MATTTNYSWTTPDDTALVKDGAAAIRSLGSSIDTTTKALNPSTTLGDIEYRSSTANTNTRLGIGSTGNVLTVSGGVPTWAAPAAGSLTLLSTTTLSGTTVTVSSISQAYKHLYCELVNATWATGNQIPQFRIDGSRVFYGYQIKENGTASGLSATSINCWSTNSSNTASGNVGSFIIYNYSSTADRKVFYFSGGENTTANYSNAASGFISDATAISQIQIHSNNSYSYNGGTLRIYGVN